MSVPSSACNGRLLKDSFRSGPENLAIDEMLLESVTPQFPPSLRFYHWAPATLSLGYFQSLEQRALHPASRSCPVVRRSSGGGAIVHDHELTYAFVTSMRDRLVDAGDLYDAFHETLIVALARLGIVGRLATPLDRGQAVEPPFLCFQRRTPGDVLVGEAKIAGSAQRRLRSGLLQHGSILLNRSASAPELPGLAELTGRSISAEEILGAWLPLLSARLNLFFVEGELSDIEKNQALAMETSRFGAIAWTRRR